MKYSVGVLDYRPSKQLAGQYDEIAKLDGYKFTLLYRRAEMGNPAWPSEFCKNCDNIVLPPPPKYLNFIPVLDSNIIPILDEHNFDAMIVFGLYDSRSVWQTFSWCRRHNKPYFIRCDSNVLVDGRFLRRLTKGWVIRHRIKHAAGMLYIGTQNRRYFETFGAKPEQLFCAPWEVDYSTLEAAYHSAVGCRDQIRRQLALPQDKCIFVSASRLVPEKGYALLIEAMADLRARENNVELIIAGEGPFRKEMEANISHLNAPVRLLGNLNRVQLAETLTASDVFVLASFTEPWGLVVNEAALCGLPMVVSHMVGAGTDLVSDGTNGFICPAYDRDSLVSALEKLARDPDLRGRMGRESQHILQQWRTQFPAVKGYREALMKVLPAR
jgi:glycosyltransferase involved in cell wall biosynthesis